MPKAKTTKQTAADALQVGTRVKFIGFRTPISGETEIEIGDELVIASFNDDDGSYNVAMDSNSAAIETLFREEFVVDGEHVPDTAVKPKKKKAKQTEAEADSGKATPVKDKAGKTIQQKSDKLKVTASVKAAMAEAGGLIEAVEKLIEKQSATDFTVGGLLAKIEETAAFETLVDEFGVSKYGIGHRGFGKFVEQHLGMKYRKAKYLTGIYRICTERGITETQIAGIGWSRLKEAIAALSDSDADIDEILSEAKSLPFDEFKAAMRKRVIDGGGRIHGNAKADQVSFSFRLFNDNASVLTQALESAKAAIGVEGDDITANSQALTHIVNEWLAMQG
jgi:ribosomal protein L23